MRTGSWLGTAAAVIAITCSPALAQQPQKPNIVIIWGDDIGQCNISAYSRGMMGYQTPNIDRIAKEGVMFTDYYAEQSCTAGRASFITGQSGLRTGLTKVGLPGATLGLQKEDPTIAELLKPLGYATGQFGKNHLGDRNEFLPTVHGFDEFYGNLYHLNAEEEPELPDYPKDPAFRAKYGPRGVMDCKASDRDDPTVDPRFGKVGKQVCTDTGPLTRARMVTIDDDIANRAVDFITAPEERRQAVLRVGQLHPHALPHPHQAWKHRPVGALAESVSRHHDRPRQECRHGSQGAGRSRHRRQHLRHVRDRQRSAHELVAGRRHDAVPQREELELGRRLPRAGDVPLAGQDQAGPGLERHGRASRPAADAGGDGGDTEVKDKLLKGHRVGDMTYKVHLDGDNLVPYLTGQAPRRPRESFLYVNDDQQLTGLRYDNWKLVFMEQRAPGTLRVWSEPFTTLRMPKIFNLRTDPYERADITSNTYYDWLLDHAFLLVPAQDYVGKFLMTFKEFPQRQKAASFNLDEVLQKLQGAVEQVELAFADGDHRELRPSRTGRRSRAMKATTDHGHQDASRWILCWLSLASYPPGLHGNCPAAEAQHRLHLADDLGNADLGYRGSEIKTPNIDKLASEGVRCESFYGMPVCTPSRAALMTGRYPMRYGLQTLVIFPSHTYGLPTDERTLPQALKEAGYRTADGRQVAPRPRRQEVSGRRTAASTTSTATSSARSTTSPRSAAD